uniref:carbohydrate sulfotransferase 7-like isoform X2 n=1 Tax=Myxine glutinosa TaxID=7769 RepID=UPI00358F8B74
MARRRALPSWLPCLVLPCFAFLFAVLSLRVLLVPGTPCNDESERASASRLFNANTSTQQKQLLLMSTWRSGSSFVGEMFNQHPSVFYVFEPLWHVWHALYPSGATAMHGAARDALFALQHCDFQVLDMYKKAEPNITSRDLFHWENSRALCSRPLCEHATDSWHASIVNTKECKRTCPSRDMNAVGSECATRAAVVIKTVRIMDLEVLKTLITDPRLQMKVIHLVRDPRAVASSRLKSKEGLIRESLQVLRYSNLQPREDEPEVPGGFIQAPQLLRHRSRGSTRLNALAALGLICEGQRRSLELALQQPEWLRGRYMLVRYEDVVHRPKQALSAMYNFLGLTPTPDLLNFAFAMVRGQHYGVEGDPFQVGSLDARAALYAWQKKLSQDDVAEVQAYCGKVMDLLGYRRADDAARLPDAPHNLLFARDYFYA